MGDTREYWQTLLVRTDAIVNNTIIYRDSYILKNNIYYFECQSQKGNFDKLILVCEKVNNKNKRHDYSRNALDYF